MQEDENGVKLAQEKVLQKEQERETVSPEPELQFAKEETAKSREDQEMRIRAILEEFLA